MARLHYVEAARKDYPEHGIYKGQSYYWWKFRHSPKRMSAQRPPRSALTQSEFLGAIYDHEDATFIPLTASSLDDLSWIAEELRTRASEVGQLGDEQEEKKGNMPDHLQESDTGQLLQGRKDRCDEIAQALNDAADEIDSALEANAMEFDEARDRVEDILNGIDWSVE